MSLIRPRLSQTFTPARKPATREEMAEDVRTLAGFGSSVLQGASFNQSDELMGKVAAAYQRVTPEAIGGAPAGTSFDELYQKNVSNLREFDANFSEENPEAALVGEIGGSLLGGGLVAGKALVKGAQLAQNLGKTGRAATNLAVGSGVGAVEGGLYAAGASEEKFGSDDYINEVQSGIKFGTLVGGGISSLGSIASQFADSKAARGMIEQITPTIDGLKNKARVFYDQVKESGSGLTGTAYGAMIRKIDKRLKSEGYRPNQHIGIKSAFADMRSELGGEVDFVTVDSLRKAAKDKAGEIGSNDTRLANVLVDEIDQFIGTMSPKMIREAKSKPVTKGLSRQVRMLKARKQNFDVDEGFYHASTHDIKSFDNSLSSSDAHFGKGMYLTTSADDASRHYASVDAPDIKQKLDLRAEQIANELDLDYSDPKIIAQARKELLGDSQGVVYPVYAKKGKTFDITKDGKQSFLRYERPEMDVADYMDEAAESVYKADYDDIADYNQVLKDKAQDLAWDDSYNFEPEGELVDFIESIRRNPNVDDGEAEKIISIIMEDSYDGGIYSKQLDEMMRTSEWYSESAATGGIMNNEVYRQALEDAGYNSVMHDADIFSGMSVDSDAKHLIIFDPTSVKSQFSSFNPKHAQSGRLIDDLDMERAIQSSPDEIAHGYKEARKTWGKAKKAELIKDMFTGAEVQASGLENGMRTKMRQIYNNARYRKLFNKEEQEAIKMVANGTPRQNVIKNVGKFGVDGGAQGQTLLPLLGAAFGGIEVTIAGSVAKNVANKMTLKNAKRLEQLVLIGGEPEKIALLYVKSVPAKLRDADELAALIENHTPELLIEMQGKVKNPVALKAVSIALASQSEDSLSNPDSVNVPRQIAFDYLGNNPIPSQRDPNTLASMLEGSSVKSLEALRAQSRTPVVLEAISIILNSKQR